MSGRCVIGGKSRVATDPTVCGIRFKGANEEIQPPYEGSLPPNSFRPVFWLPQILRSLTVPPHMLSKRCGVDRRAPFEFWTAKGLVSLQVQAIGEALFRVPYVSRTSELDKRRAHLPRNHTDVPRRRPNNFLKIFVLIGNINSIIDYCSFPLDFERI